MSEAKRQPLSLVLRLPHGLHEQLKIRAASEGVSLNTLLVGLLSGAVAWGQPEKPARALQSQRKGAK